ncbi:hypothetical protein GGI02_000391 [Coemansia sp. RSA 2322]|nr:hypothetical protein GGI02_000391 [Coemansia sp. RSA 2322]KAJ2486929.1 hypothetical protein EV174_000829 [Coemansia sp. RSA 2320]
MTRWWQRQCLVADDDSGDEHRQPANFLDLHDNNYIGAVGFRQQRQKKPHSLCLPSLPRRPGPTQRTPKAAAAAAMQSRGISWADSVDALSWQAVSSNRPSEEDLPCGGQQCRHCNMRVSPAATRAWHERMCALSSAGGGHTPAQCELCHRPFASVGHARNHYLYGCRPHL